MQYLFFKLEASGYYQLKNDIFDIPCNIALDVVDVIGDLDSA
jgi:hypothetical protein